MGCQPTLTHAGVIRFQQAVHLNVIHKRCNAGGLDLARKANYRRLLLPTPDGSTEFCHPDKNGTADKFTFAFKFVPDLLLGSGDEVAETQNLDGGDTPMPKRVLREVYTAWCTRACHPYPEGTPLMDAERDTTPSPPRADVCAILQLFVAKAQNVDALGTCYGLHRRINPPHHHRFVVKELPFAPGAHPIITKDSWLGIKMLRGCRSSVFPGRGPVTINGLWREDVCVEAVLPTHTSTTINGQETHTESESVGRWHMLRYKP